ncbi:MAG: Hpt domain-containing protein [Treponema sp.]|jgi:HPt (histidine-containing phosphotransfer) domain-containing protein|nr:Hpt domain-containing protein [Treponema sp.]
MAENEGIVYIDWDDGLKRVMNNLKLYIRLLDKFKAGTNLNDLSAALAAGDYEKAQAAAHTVKGVAANLSLMELYKQALGVEEQIKAQSVKPGAFDALNACFTETLVSIDKAIADHV